jgi:hypothetical protein
MNTKLRIAAILLVIAFLMYLILPLYAQVILIGIAAFEVIKRKSGHGFSYSPKQNSHRVNGA